MLPKIILGLAALTFSLAAQEPPELAMAREAAEDFTGALTQRLFQELQAGGPTRAIEVCSEVGLQIPAELGRQRGVSLRRTTLRPRNPHNAPTAAERAHLERLAALHAEGRLPAEEWELTATELIYRRPLRASAVCLACHGPTDTLAASTRQRLAERYPSDQATGYQAGDLRGMLVVRVPRQSRAISLPQAIALALTNNPDLASARQRVAAARAGLQQTEAALWPQVRAVAGYAASDNPVQAFMMTLNQRALDMATANFNQPGTTDNFNGRLLAQWSLYDGGQTLAGRQAAQHHIEAAHQQLAAARNDLVFEVTRAYHTIGKARQFVAVAQEAVNSLAATVNVASNRVMAGQALKTDWLDAEVRLAEARENLLRAGNALTLSELVFRITLGLDAHDNVTAQDPDPDEATDAAPTTASDRQDAASDARPELGAARAAVAAAEREVRAARAGHRPRLQAFASYDLDSGNASRFEDSWLAGIGIELPVFDGFLTRGKIAEARARLETARQQQRKLALAVALEHRQAELELAEARARLVTARTAVARAEESLQLTKHRYAEGLALVVQLLDAETALSAARQRYAAARADVRIAEAALARALGQTGNE